MHQLTRVEAGISSALAPETGTWAVPSSREARPYVFARLGVVHGVRTWSETRVSGEGGGGFVFRGTGFTSGVNVSSKTSTKEAFFVRHADGTDTPVTLENAPGAVADGQEVVLVFGSRTRPDWGHLFALHNERTGRSIFLKSGMTAIAPAYGLWTVGFALVALLIALMLVPELSLIVAVIGALALHLLLRIVAFVGHYWPLTRALQRRARGLLLAPSSA